MVPSATAGVSASNQKYFGVPNCILQFSVLSFQLVLFHLKTDN